MSLYNKMQLLSSPINIRGEISCTTNVSYMLKCPRGKAYIGKTRRAPKARTAEHRSAIRNGDERSPLAIHFKKSLLKECYYCTECNKSNKQIVFSPQK